MKKFKSILCITFAFILTAIVLCACGTNNNKENQEMVGTKTIISLAEAERLIVSALSIDNNQLQTQSTRGMVLHAADASEGNRDVYEKLGTFDISEYHSVINVETEEESPKGTMSGKASYHNGFQTFLLDYNNYDSGIEQQGYWININNNYFEKSHGGINHSQKPFEESFGGFTALFSDEAFDRVYDKEATKEINKDGYSITLTGDLKRYALYTYIQSDNADAFESDWAKYQEKIKDYSQYIDKCRFSATINIDNNNNVFSAVLDVVMFNVNDINNNIKVNLQKQLFTFTKTNTSIEEPTWVTDYRQKHNIA